MSSDVPQVTVLIPVYNGARFIKGAIESVLAQNDADVETIVIDDGSTDDTPHILDGYGDAIRVIRQKNAGHVVARNNGAKVASGKWLAFLDADDEWLPNKLSHQLAIADDSIGMVYTDRENFGMIDRVLRVQSEGVQLWEGDIFEKLLSGNFVTVSSVIMRKDWFERLEGFDADLLVCEDWDMWLRFSAAGGLAAICREPLTRYRWHSESMSFNQERMRQGRLKVVRRALATPRGMSVSRRVARRAISSAWACSAWHARPTHRWAALRWQLTATWYDPWKLGNFKQLAKCFLGRA